MRSLLFDIRNKKLLVTSALLVVTMFANRNKKVSERTPKGLKSIEGRIRLSGKRYEGKQPVATSGPAPGGDLAHLGHRSIARDSGFAETSRGN